MGNNVKDKDRIQLIKLLLDDLDDLGDVLAGEDLESTLVEHYRNRPFPQAAGVRLADLIGQYANCEGPFGWGDDGEVLPGKVVLIDEDNVVASLSYLALNESDKV